MKQLLFVIITLLLLGNETVKAQVTINRTEIFLDKRDLPIGKDQTGDEHDSPAGRSVSQPALGFLSDKIVTVCFEESILNATITITNVSTGETIYSESHDNPVIIDIDLSPKSLGEYVIKILSDTTCLQGSFSL